MSGQTETSEFFVKPSPHRSYVRELLRQLPDGYQIGFIYEHRPGGPKRKVNRNHPGVLTPSGEILRDHRGVPVQVSGTPGDVRAMRNDLAQVRRAIDGRAG